MCVCLTWRQWQCIFLLVGQRNSGHWPFNSCVCSLNFIVFLDGVGANESSKLMAPPKPTEQMIDDRKLFLAATSSLSLLMMEERKSKNGEQAGGLAGESGDAGHLLWLRGTAIGKRRETCGPPEAEQRTNGILSSKVNLFHASWLFLNYVFLWATGSGLGSWSEAGGERRDGTFRWLLWDDDGNLNYTDRKNVKCSACNFRKGCRSDFLQIYWENVCFI